MAWRRRKGLNAWNDFYPIDTTFKAKTDIKRRDITVYHPEYPFSPPYEWAVYNHEGIVSERALDSLKQSRDLIVKQVEFAQAVAKLVTFAAERNTFLTIKDAYLDPRVHGVWGEKIKCYSQKCCHTYRKRWGKVGYIDQSSLTYAQPCSLHKIRLAITTQMVVYDPYEGHRVETKLGNHEPLADYWKTLHPDARWGGDAKLTRNKDASRYLFAHFGLDE